MPSVNRRCARPGCHQLASATLSFLYAQQIVWIDDLHVEASPANHDLCATHADRTRPPRGWDLSDRRFGAASVLEPQEGAVAQGDGSGRLRRAG